jgi:hypothetical protein
MSRLVVRWDKKGDPIELHHGSDVPPGIMSDQFDWLDENERVSQSFAKHRGYWYHLSQFMRVQPGGRLERGGWAGYHGDSFFSGVAIRFYEDQTHYKCGLVLSLSGGGEE